MSPWNRVALALAVLLSVGCSSEKAETTAELSFAALPAGFLLPTAPEGAKPLIEVKSTAKAGDEVAFECRIGGRSAPFVESRAVMVVIDPSLPSCADNPGDSCPAPWDYCCETKDTLIAATATVQIVDAAGKPILGTLKGNQGLAPLARVTVVGKVKENETGRFVVNATGVFIDKES